MGAPFILPPPFLPVPLPPAQGGTGSRTGDASTLNADPSATAVPGTVARRLSDLDPANSGTTPDALAAATALSATDEVLIRQGGSIVLRALMSSIAAYALGLLPTRYDAVSLAAAPATLSASANRSVVTVTSAGTLTLDPSVPDGWRVEVVNAASGIVALAAGSGGQIAASGALASLLPGYAATVRKVSLSGVPTFQIVGGTPAPQIAILSAPGVLTGNAVAVSLAYANYTPTAFDYSTDGVAWTAAPSPTISGGAASFSIAGLAVGSYTLFVRDRANPSVFAGPYPVQVASSALSNVNTPASVLQGGSVSIAGTFIGSPAAIQAAFDNTTAWTTIANAPAGGKFSGTLAAPAVGSHTVKVRFADGSAVSANSGAFTVTGVPAITVATPANVAALGSVSVSGAYVYASPTGVDYRVLYEDGTVAVDWTTASGATIGSGSYSFSIAGLGQSYYQVQVRLTDTPSATATSDWFAVGNAILILPYSQTAVAGSIISYTGKTTISTSGIRWQFDGQGTSGNPTIALGTLSSGAFSASNFIAPAKAGTWVLRAYDAGISTFQRFTITTTAATSPALSVIPTALSKSISTAFTLTGYYGGGTPTALDYSVDGGSTWRTDGTTTLDGSGGFSLAVPAVGGSTGNKSVQVRWRNSTSTVAGYGTLTFGA